MLETAVSDQLVAELTRDVIVQTAPQEMPLFRATSEAYFKDPPGTLQGKSGKDEMLGFGDGGVITFLTPIALTVMGEVVKFLVEEVKKSLTTEGSGIINEAVKSLFTKFRPKENNKVPPLTKAQLAQVKELAMQKAIQLKLPGNKSTALVDAIISGLATQ